MVEQKEATVNDTASARRLLNAFVGTWRTVGVFYRDDTASIEAATRSGSVEPAVRMLATDRYEWLPGRAFLAHHWDAQMPDGRTSGLEVIGYDATNNVYPMHAFDNHGTITIMQATHAENVWTFTGDALRFTGGFGDAGATFAGQWMRRAETSDTWVPWMELTLTRDVDERLL